MPHWHTLLGQVTCPAAATGLGRCHTFPYLRLSHCHRDFRCSAAADSGARADSESRICYANMLCESHRDGKGTCYATRSRNMLSQCHLVTATVTRDPRRQPGNRRPGRAGRCKETPTILKVRFCPKALATPQAAAGASECSSVSTLPRSVHLTSTGIGCHMREGEVQA